MHLFNQLRIITVVALTTALVAASPIDDDTVDLVVTKVVPVGEYNLTYWSDIPRDGSRAARAPVPCSGSNDVTCSGSHTASSSICNQLITHINANGGTPIADSPRAVCLGQSGNQCCVSWSAAVGTMPQSDLYNAANKIYHNCFGGSISGLARNVNLNGGCVTECLSNRPNGCS
ncbi:hypothetical protein C8R45DRAFT_1094565 [Mycena sanguinolenta]|nr:hypothetical protein C8R45DRAFT_1094565 [Mycena sanguinolenta]